MQALATTTANISADAATATALPISVGRTRISELLLWLLSLSSKVFLLLLPERSIRRVGLCAWEFCLDVRSLQVKAWVRQFWFGDDNMSIIQCFQSIIMFPS